MNLDLRNIDFEEELKEIMRKKNIATASKCIRSIVLDHKRLNKRIKDLEEILSKERKENISLLEERKKIKNAFSVFVEILT